VSTPRLSGVVLGALLLAASCAGDAAPPADEALPVRRYQFDPDLAPEVTGGLAVAQVVAQGDGCPTGNWFTEIERDGKSFRVRLVGYETEVDHGRAASTRSCKLSIKLRSRVPVAFALRSIAYIGYAYLDDGVRARFETQPYFDQDAPAGPVDALQLSGPYESEFVQQAQADVLRWSGCGVERDVHVQTTIGVHNATPPGIGFIGIGEAHGTLPTAVDSARFGITFAVRTCDDPVDASVPAPVTLADAGAADTAHDDVTLLGGLDSGVPNTEPAAPDTK
jgi:hypothetical protein